MPAIQVEDVAAALEKTLGEAERTGVADSATRGS
jgi:hypothetical protein